MIYTCTISPSIDFTIYLEELQIGSLNRTERTDYFPGGKGINVSRVLQGLGVKNTAIAFAGGFTGDYIAKFLQDEGIMTDFIKTDEITRINAKIKSGVETEINGAGPLLTEMMQDELLEKVEQYVKGDTFVLAGSLPVAASVGFYKNLANICHERGVHFVLDTSGPILKELIREKPFLIKPNQAELAELCGVEISNQADAIYYAQELVALGVENVIVSLGGDGAIFVNEDLVLTAETPIGKVVNTVGAGDSLVAGFLAAYQQSGDVFRAFQTGVASGSATAFQADLCTLSDVEEIINQVKIRQI